LGGRKNSEFRIQKSGVQEFRSSGAGVQDLGGGTFLKSKKDSRSICRIIGLLNSEF
jgi:hypothetical protein